MARPSQQLPEDRKVRHGEQLGDSGGDFPQNPENLLPHRAPLLLLDSVDGMDDAGAWGSVTLRSDNPFMDQHGLLERVAFAEIMAQCFAAFGAGQTGRTGRTGSGQSSRPAVGYLAALRDVRVLGDARLGDVLHVKARCTATLGGISVVEGEVRCGEQLLATGQCKVFVPEAEA